MAGWQKKAEMKLTIQEIAAVNQISRWLARDDLSASGMVPDAPLLILAGHAVLPNIEGALARVRRDNLDLLVSGGIGHSTALLRAAIAAHPRYQRLNTSGKSEAEMLSAIAVQFFGIAPEKILLDIESGNCGQNAAFSQRVLSDNDYAPSQVILVQDPLMQRRTGATFQHQWRQMADAPVFINWPVFIPQLVTDNGLLRITGAAPQGLWSIERFLALLLGEIPRLRDDADGYGPQGKGFIAHVDIPQDILIDWQLLMMSETVSIWLSR